MAQIETWAMASAVAAPLKPVALAINVLAGPLKSRMKDRGPLQHMWRAASRRWLTEGGADWAQLQPSTDTR